jgi:hypothetical protein
MPKPEGPVGSRASPFLETSFMKGLYLGVIALAFAVIGCNDSTEPEGIYGKYIMKSYNGHSLPALISENSSGMLEMQGGSITIKSNMTFIGDFQRKLSLVSTGGSTDADVELGGTYTMAAENLTFDGAGVSIDFTAVLDGNILTATVDGVVMTFEK